MQDQILIAMPSKKRTKASTVFVIFPCLIVALATLGYSVADSCIQEHAIERHGLITNGMAYFTEFKGMPRGGGAYHVRYLFYYNGTKYNCESQALDNWVNTTKLPAEIRIQFLPDRPDINRLPDVGIHRSVLLEVLFLVFCLSLISYLGRKIVLALLNKPQNLVW